MLDKTLMQFVAEETVRVGFDTFMLVIRSHSPAVDDHLHRNPELEAGFLVNGKHDQANMV